MLLGVGEQRALRHHDFVVHHLRVRRWFEAAIAGPAATQPIPSSTARLAIFVARAGARAGRPRSPRASCYVRRDQALRLREVGLPTLAVPRGPRRTRRSPTSPARLRGLARTRQRLQLSGGPRGARPGTPSMPTPVVGSRPPCPSAVTPSSTLRAIRSGSRPAACTSCSGCSCTRVRLASTVPSGCMILHGGELFVETFVDLVHEWLARDPGMHVYHYGATRRPRYPTARRGASRAGEDVVDEPLMPGNGVFVHVLDGCAPRGAEGGSPESYTLKRSSCSRTCVRATTTSRQRAPVRVRRVDSVTTSPRVSSIARYNEVTVAWTPSRCATGSSITRSTPRDWREAAVAAARGRRVDAVERDGGAPSSRRQPPRIRQLLPRRATSSSTGPGARAALLVAGTSPCGATI